MCFTVLIKNLNEPFFCKDEILRYAGCKEENEDIVNLMNSCIDEIREKLSYKVCYICLPAEVKGDICSIGTLTVKSEKLSRFLSNSNQTVLLAATIGTEIDRVISKYSRISPSRALLMQAIGTERVEALCDMFQAEFEKENGVYLSGRFSPGYGDLPIETQKEIFAVLNCSKHIGLTLNDSLLMSPTKSVTAFASVLEKPQKYNGNKCTNCNKNDCVYRGVK